MSTAPRTIFLFTFMLPALTLASDQVPDIIEYSLTNTAHGLMGTYRSPVTGVQVSHVLCTVYYTGTEPHATDVGRTVALKPDEAQKTYFKLQIQREQQLQAAATLRAAAKKVSQNPQPKPAKKRCVLL